MDAGLIEAAEVLEDSIEEADHVRRAASIEVAAPVIDDVEQRLDAVRGRVAAYFGVTLTGREGAGFLRYRPGGFYLPHRDRASVASWPGAARRRITVVVFLNSSEFRGGLLRVGGRAIMPEAGTMAAFASDTLHEVTPVEGGVRDTVVDWFLD